MDTTTIDDAPGPRMTPAPPAVARPSRKTAIAQRLEDTRWGAIAQIAGTLDDPMHFRLNCGPPSCGATLRLDPVAGAPPATWPAHACPLRPAPGPGAAEPDRPKERPR